MADEQVDTRPEIEALSLSDEQLWGDPVGALGNAIVDRIEVGHTGLEITAPAQVVISGRDTLPIVGLYIASLREAKTAELYEQLLLVAFNPGTQQLLAATAYPPREMLREPLESDDDPGEGLTGMPLHFDAFERLQIPREPGTWLIELIHRGQVSNRVEVVLLGDPGGYRDEAVEEYLRAQAGRVSPRRTVPAIPQTLGQALPAFDDDAASAPEVPEELGLRLRAPRVFLRREGAACVLEGSFRLKARTRDLVDEARWPKPDKGRGGIYDYEPPVPAAVLPVTLLTTGAIAAGPRLTRLELPSFDDFDPEQSADLAPSTYTARFALDLEALDALMYDPQTCFIYAFAGELRSDPVLVGVVTPDMLPPGHPDAR